jgi:acyl-CoA thioester hydrolase
VTENAPKTRANYSYFREVSTRWYDNDIYGHVNNAVYYVYFDTVISGFLVREGQLDYVNGPTIGIIPETRCRYRKPLRFPDVIDAGLAVTRLGRTSVVYDISLFRAGEDDAAAEGHFVHVFVDRKQQDQTRPIPDDIRTALSALVREPAGD